MAQSDQEWIVRSIGVIGPGIVGMPMAALLANARICIGTDTPATVTVVQRRSPTSGWKVDAINRGESVIGGIEPALDAIVGDAVRDGLLCASDDPRVLTDADVIMVCVQTDKDGIGPDYQPLYAALDGLIGALLLRAVDRPAPLIIFESTLAPSSMATLVRDRFAASGLVDGVHVLLGNSPNRVMPGRLVERVAASDKLAGGLSPLAATRIARLYRNVVTGGTMHPTSSLTAEIVKTLENAYRDVRIAFSTEVAQACEALNIDFFALRDAVNAKLAQSDGFSSDAASVPTGALLVPMIGVGGHCLPKDGVLLWWRAQTAPVSSPGRPDPSTSLILESRRINDDQPDWTMAMAERAIGALSGRKVAVLGVAYRADADDTRNAPGLSLVRLLLRAGADVHVHDPFVRSRDVNVAATVPPGRLTSDLATALLGAEAVFVCVAHEPYRAGLTSWLESLSTCRVVVDGARVIDLERLRACGMTACGVGRGSNRPPTELIDAVADAFRAVELGVANEVDALVRYYDGLFRGPLEEACTYEEVRRLAATCPTTCALPAPGPVSYVARRTGFSSRLVDLAVTASRVAATAG